MVEQNCVYERKMTVTYVSRNESYDEDTNGKDYERIKQEMTKVLYEKGYPLVSQYYSMPYDELEKDDYFPSKQQRTTNVFHVSANGERVAQCHWKSDARDIIDALNRFIELNELPMADIQVEDVTTITEKVVMPDKCFKTLMPYTLLSEQNLQYERSQQDMDISDNDNVTDALSHKVGSSSKVSTQLDFNRYETTLTFTIRWAAPVKSTKANITKYLVDMPELLTARVMNAVEEVLSGDWDLDEDKTSIDCVTQSNINTKAECSPAVISSLRKTKAEL